MAWKTNGQSDLDFTTDLFKAADKLRGNLEPSEYEHVALGLIFLKYISDAFEAERTKLEAEKYADAEDPEEYLAAKSSGSRGRPAGPICRRTPSDRRSAS